MTTQQWLEYLHARIWERVWRRAAIGVTVAALTVVVVSLMTGGGWLGVWLIAVLLGAEIWLFGRANDCAERAADVQRGAR